nr:hypothetical protein [Paraflavitalea speifideiaquila]
MNADEEDFVFVEHGRHINIAMFWSKKIGFPLSAAVVGAFVGGEEGADLF